MYIDELLRSGLTHVLAACVVALCVSRLHKKKLWPAGALLLLQLTGAARQ
jgi:hypothetical protein